MGNRSGWQNTTAINNTFIGNYAGASNTSASYNTFVGTAAGTTNTTGNSNSFLGFNAGYHNTSGTANTLLGTGAGENNTEGSQNTFVGQVSGYLNTTGSQNAFFGQSSGQSNTTGAGNVFMGFGSGYGNSTGKENTFLGMQSGSANSQGNNNTLIGKGAGYGNTSGSNNTFIGRNAGFANVTGGNNIYLGNESIPVGPNAGGLQNVVAIGAYAKVAISDAIVLGDTANTNIKVGIGTAAPRYPLDVKGNVNIRRGTSGPGKLIFASRSSLHIDDQDYIVLTGGKAGESGLRLANLPNQATSMNTANRFLSVDEQGRVGLYQPTVPASQITLKVNRPDQWADYVFAGTYSLMSLDQLKQYVRINRHLPGFPSAEEMAQKGASVESLMVNIVKTQEEQAQYLIQLKAENDQLRKENQEIKDLVKQLIQRTNK